MRRMTLGALAVCLAALVWARACLPETAEALEPETESYGCNMLELGRPPVTETAGSGIMAEMSGYYFARPATEKNAYTGVLAGKNLILICADGWAASPAESAALGAMAEDGAVFAEVYRPDWYQGMDGRVFALLTGIVPTSVNGQTALSWLERQDVYLPFTLARTLGEQGYESRAYIPGEDRRAAYERMGFSQVRVWKGAAAELVSATAEECLSQTPFFAFYIWEDEDGEAALEALFAALSERGLAEDTAVCLLTAGAEADRAGLYLYGEGLSGAAAAEPCSELDVTPTLLNLFGAGYDSRFLSGRDALAPVTAAGEAAEPLCLVSLYGSAYSDWVTDAGRYSAGGGFQPEEGVFPSEKDGAAYAREVSRLVYDRYIFARRVMENNYFQLVFG